MLQTGTVVSVHGEFAKVQCDDGRIRRLRSRRQLTRLASGDVVQWRAQRGGGSIETLKARRSLLARTDPNGNKKPIAANLDLVAVVWSPVPNTPVAFIDRYLAHLAYNRLQAILIGNKLDRDDATFSAQRTQLRDLYTKCGYTWLDVSAKAGVGIDTLATELSNKTCAVVGQSGVGKSSIVNALSTPETQATGRLTDDEAHGTHTTSAARLVELQCGGTLIDSPGVRDIATAYLPPRDVSLGFPEMSELSSNCKFRDCLHQAEPECAVNDAVRRGEIAKSRMQSYAEMLYASLEAEHR